MVVSAVVSGAAYVVSLLTTIAIAYRCNRLNFVDVMRVRHGLYLPADTGGLPAPLPMPPCLGCGRADGFEIGSTDYIQAIKDRER